MDGFSSHTCQWVNAAGEAFWVKVHFKTDQGIETLTAERAAEIAGQHPDHAHADLLGAIDRGAFPSWTVKVQVMPAAEAATYKFNPFDLTKVWHYADYPLIEIGKLTLDRNPQNYFAEVEQAAFSPGNFVPGIGPSPDKMLQGRLFAYADAHRYRLTVNYEKLPVNAPHAAQARNYGRDGFMAFDGNGGRSANYEPNTVGGPVESGRAGDAGVAVTGAAGSYAPVLHAQDDDFVQAGDLYRLMSDDEQERLVANLAGSLAQVTLPGVVAQAIDNFRKADADYGARLDAAVATRTS